MHAKVSMAPMQVCLTGSIQENNCAVGSHSCWRNDTLDVGACIDTYRGYKCKCPEGTTRNNQSWNLIPMMLVVLMWWRLIKLAE